MRGCHRLASLAVVSVVVCLGCGGSSSPTRPSATTAAPSPTYTIPAADLADMLSEQVMGNAGASVSIIEYSSLTCPHCTSFHVSTLPQIKAVYIDTGKVKLVYRDFPVAGASTVPTAYAAAALARCAGSARYFDALDLLARGQAGWTSASNPTGAMKQALAPLGMPSEKMDACVASPEIQAAINRVMTDGRDAYGITGTPTFIVGGQKVVGTKTFAEFDAILAPLVK